jgi:D-alanine transaminase
VPAPLPLAHLNGAVIAVAESRVSALDRGFLFADGVYEAIAVYDGRPFRLAEHLSRLARSLREMRIADPHDPPTWRALIEALIAGNGGGAMSVYLQVTRGADLAVIVTRRRRTDRVRLLLRLERPARALVKNGVAVISAYDVRWGRCDIKSINSPPMSSRARRRSTPGPTGLFVRDGRVLEGSPSSFMIVEGRRRDAARRASCRARRAISCAARRRSSCPGSRSGQRRAPARRGRGLDREHDARVLAVTRLDGAVVGAGQRSFSSACAMHSARTSTASSPVRRAAPPPSCSIGRAAAQDHQAGGTRPARARARADRATRPSRPRACASVRWRVASAR